MDLTSVALLGNTIIIYISFEGAGILLFVTLALIDVPC